MAKARAFVFTINNPTEEETPSLEKWGAQYLVFQKERGESGTDHYQGYVYFKGQQRMSYLKKLNSRAHWEVRRGTHDEAYAYCTKEDTRIDGPFEFGEAPNQQGKRTDIELLFDGVKAGKPLKELAEEHTNAYVRYHKAVLHLKGMYFEKRTEKPLVCWYYGETGTGKTRKAFEDNPDAYFKDMSNGKWWDGYEQQSCVVFDDMRKDTFKLHELLRILDRYPLQVEYKGGSIPFNSPKIIITSCYHPAKMYETNENIQQLLRRIDVITEFKCLKESHPPSPPLSPDVELSKIDDQNLAMVSKACNLEVSGVSKIDDLFGMETMESQFLEEGFTRTPEANVLEHARKKFKQSKEDIVAFSYTPDFNGPAVL